MKKQYVVLDADGNPIEGATVQVEETEEEAKEGFFRKIAKKVKGVNPKTAAKVATGFVVGIAAGGLGAKVLDRRNPEGVIEADYKVLDDDAPYTVDSPEVQDLL